MSTPVHSSPLRRVRHRLRNRVSEHPSVYLPFARRKYPGPSPEVIGPATELVIDGYTRSASTFAVYAFQLAQPRPVRLAHHLHAPAQLIAAAHAGIPALLLLRHPQQAVLSQLVREPGVALPDALSGYLRFHSCLLRYRDAYVVGDFTEVTTDFGSVVRRLNARFGTSFAEFEGGDDKLRDCFSLVALRDTLSPVLLGFESGTVGHAQLRQEIAALERSSAPTATTGAWVPSAERDRAKRELLEQWNDPRLTNLRDSAVRMYESLRGDRR
jgi:hypothetical protein